MTQLRVKNWSRYQHYKDRCPPWIKLATDTFQNYEFSRLQDASKLLAICIWTLAARSKDGSVPNDFEYLKTQGCLGSMIKPEHLKELIKQGFVETCSEVLADCKQSACSEGEGEGETEESREDSPIVPSERIAPTAPPVLVFPCNGSPKSWDLTREQVEIWSGLYPGVQVEAECRKALAWVLANGSKTAGGMPKFLVRWLNKETDKPRTQRHPALVNADPRCAFHKTNDSRKSLFPTASCPRCKHFGAKSAGRESEPTDLGEVMAAKTREFEAKFEAEARARADAAEKFRQDKAQDAGAAE